MISLRLRLEPDIVIVQETDCAPAQKTRESQGLAIRQSAALKCAPQVPICCMLGTSKGVGHISAGPTQARESRSYQTDQVKDERGKQKNRVRVLKINTPLRTDAHTTSVRRKILELAAIKTGHSCAVALVVTVAGAQ